MLFGRRTLMTPPTIRPKNGSAKKRRMSGSSSCDTASETTSATVPLRCVTSDRAALSGTYPVASTACQTISCSLGSTLRTPLMTRETVARDTPAASATSSSVGRRFSLITRFYSTPRGKRSPSKARRAHFPVGQGLPIDTELPQRIAERGGPGQAIHPDIARIAVDVDVVETTVAGG